MKWLEISQFTNTWGSWHPQKFTHSSLLQPVWEKKETRHSESDNLNLSRYSYSNFSNVISIFSCIWKLYRVFYNALPEYQQHIRSTTDRCVSNRNVRHLAKEGKIGLYFTSFHTHQLFGEFILWHLLNINKVCSTI